MELVLPGAYYLVRLLDGRIDVQGTTEELRERGVLDAITKDSSVENHLQIREKLPDATNTEAAPGETKKPRQLVKDEAREIGGVKWRIYKTYMKATSYWTWIALSIGICIYQLLGVTEKLWIKQWGDVCLEIITILHSTTYRTTGLHQLQRHQSGGPSLLFHISARRRRRHLHISCSYLCSVL